MRLLIVTGLPATGKTTLARQLAHWYGVPLLAKDAIKEPLLDALGAGDAAHSRRLSDLSFELLFTQARKTAQTGGDLIIEGNFRAGEHDAAIRDLAAARTVQILCRIPEPVRMRRLAARSRDPHRHPGHGDVMAAPDASNDNFLDLPGERLLFGPDQDAAGLLQQLEWWWKPAPLPGPVSP